jgi:toxin YoeB
MEVIYSSVAEEDRAYWKKNHPKIFQRIEDLIANIRATPFTGLGKPERLKFKKSGYWSRRINQEHRLVYKVVDKRIYIAQCRYHYD